jgi:hypothetical protein
MRFFSSNIPKDRSIAALISFHELSPYVIYWHFHDWQAPVLSINDYHYRHPYFWKADYFLEVKASPGSPYRSEWLDKIWNDKLEPLLLRGGYIKLAAAKEFPDLGLTAYLYQRLKDI